MGLQETIQSVTQTALQAVGNIAKSIQYKEFIEAEWDEDLQETITVYHVHVDLKAVKVDYDKRLIDNELIKPNDQRFLIASNDLSPTPKPQDQIFLIEDYTVWQVITAGTDPATALWDLQCRKIEA